MAWCTTHEAGMNQTRKSYPWNMATAGKDPFEIPDRLGSKRIMLVKKSASILLMEDAREPPRLTREGLNIEDFHNEHVSGMRTLNLHRSRQVMNATTVSWKQKFLAPQVHGKNIISAVVVLDLSAGPINALDIDWLPWLNFGERGDVRMPPIVELRLRICGLIEVDAQGSADGRHLRSIELEGRVQLRYEWTIS